MKFAELLKKKAAEGKFLSEDEKAAKLGVVKEIDDMMGEVMGDNLKKVTVAADSKEGLEAGLEKAKEVIEKKDEYDKKAGEMYNEEGYDQEMMDDDHDMMKKHSDYEDQIKILEEKLAKYEKMNSHNSEY